MKNKTFYTNEEGFILLNIILDQENKYRKYKTVASSQNGNLKPIPNKVQSVIETLDKLNINDLQRIERIKDFLQMPWIGTQEQVLYQKVLLHYKNKVKSKIIQL